MDEYGTDFAAPVVSKVKKESERLEKIHGVNVASTQNDQPPPPVAPVVMAPDRGRKLVFDNFDFKQHVHNMTEDHQNVDVHWVSHAAVENRVSGCHLSSEKPDINDLAQLENGLCLPNHREHILQKENYITLAERVIVELPCLEFLKQVVCKHIPHKYRKEAREKSEIVRFLSFLFSNSQSMHNALQRRLDIP